MIVQQNVSLAPYTSLRCGGPAERLITIEHTNEVEQALHTAPNTPLWPLGYGCNALISDTGLPGTTLLFRTNTITQKDGLLIADAGVWWDDFVQYAIGADLWGLELMSAIPGGVGAAVVGNIAAYGQAVKHTLAWIEVLNTHTMETAQLLPETLGLDYRYSNLQEPEQSHLIILRAAFQLSATPTTEVTYGSALEIAQAKDYALNTLQGRRQTILEARDHAGSLWNYRDTTHESNNAGSFFRNPLVTPEQAQTIIGFDESGKTAETIQKMNAVHGGDALRVSAAHVLLAAGFRRGQTWGDVRLHPRHILKLENAGAATASDIHAVVQEILSTVKTKLDIDLHPEVRFLGEF